LTVARRTALSGLPTYPLDVIRVLSAQFHDSEITQEALEDLRGQLNSAGLDTTVGDPEEPRRVRLRKSVEPGPVVDVLLVVLEDVREGLIGAAAVAVIAWAKRRGPFRRRNGARPVAVIWGPNGEVLREVELPDEEQR
jgi:hypothetical protein